MRMTKRALRDGILRLIIALTVGACFVLGLIAAQPLIAVLGLVAVAFCLAPFLISDRAAPMRNRALDA